MEEGSIAYALTLKLIEAKSVFLKSTMKELADFGSLENGFCLLKSILLQLNFDQPCWRLPKSFEKHILREQTPSFNLGHRILPEAVQSGGATTGIPVAINFLNNLGFAELAAEIAFVQLSS